MQPFLDGARFSVALAANAGISAASLEWLCRGCLLIYPQHGFRFAQYFIFLTDDRRWFPI